MKKTILKILILFFITIPIYSQNATITGRVIDATTGQPMLGVAVIIREVGAFAQTDFDGKYTLSVPPGTYTVFFQIMGYETKSQRITVNPGQNLSLNMTMGVAVLAKVVVEERALNDTEASLLSLQKKAPVVSDGISQEAIKRSPDSSASDVVKRVTGISIIGGKYVFVRGLGERYSLSMLNGSILPSPEPDKKVVPLDLFPAPLIKNIRIIKSFVPEDPAEFSGGIVKIETVEYPDQFLFNAGLTLERNSITTGNQFKIMEKEGQYDFLGLGPSSITGLNKKEWNIPGIAGSLPDIIPLTAGSFGVTDSLIDFAYLSFYEKWSPKTINAPYNLSFNLSIGDSVLNKSLGYIFSTYYKKEYEKYNAEEYRWYGDYYIAGSWLPELSYITELNQIRNANYYSEKILWGNNFNLSYKINNKNQIYLKTFFSTNSDKNFRDSFVRMEVPDRLDFATETSYYVAREIFSLTLGGNHGIQYYEEMKPHRLNWHYNYSRATRDEPNRRNRVWSKTYYTDEPLRSSPNDGFIFYSFAEDIATTIHLDYELDYPQWDGLNSKLKFGIDNYIRDKTFKSKDYKIELLTIQDYDLNLYPLPGEITFSPGRFFNNEFYFNQRSAQSNDGYEAELNVNSRFIQTDLPIIPNLRFIGGIRQEDTYQKAWTRKYTSISLRDYIGQQCTPEGLEDLRPYLIEKAICPADDFGVGDYKVTDNLPSMNFVYEFIKDQNLRLSYYESITRPDSRELSEFTFTPYFAGEVFTGNSTLKRSKLKNYDFRWEWYITPEEYLGISYFVKFINDPIEVVGTPRTGGGNKSYTFINSPKADLKGWEFDFRKDFFKHFRTEFNLYFIKSEVIVMEPLTRALIAGGYFSIYDKKVSLAPTNLKRPLQGQSDFVYNIKFYYYFDQDKKIGYVGLLYNYFSDRILFVGTSGEPDIKERGKGFWDFVASYNPKENLTLKASIKNIFNQTFETYQKSNLGNYEVTYERYKKGIDYNFSLSYKF